MSASRRALVLGATGQTGSYLVDLLLSKDYAVSCLVRRTSTMALPRLAHVQDRVTILSGDLTDGPSLERAIQDVRPHEVYNFAAQSHVATSFTQPLLTAEVTGVGALRLFEALRQVGPPRVRVFQASSSEMFGLAPAPQSEATPLAPVSPYGCAKVFAHLGAALYRTAYGLHISCGIAFNHESPRRGEAFVTRKITQGVAAIVQGSQRVLCLGRLDTKRDWLHAKDVAWGAWRMLQQDTPDDYVLASGESHTVREFVETAFAIAHRNPAEHVREDPTLFRPTDPLDLRGDATKARRVLGWQPTVFFPALVEEMVAHDIAAVPAFPRHR